MDLFEAFMLTNGSGSAEYTMQCLDNQTVPCKITVLKNMSLIGAMKKCISMCESRFFLKIDDDMFLHPRAFEYIRSNLEVMKNNENVAIYWCLLWEKWNNRVVRSVKSYRHRIAKKVEFKADHRGKIDKLFVKRYAKFGYERRIDDSVVGIHALRSVEDQKKYRTMWSKRCPSDLKSVDPDQATIHKSFNGYEFQVNAIHKLSSVNKKTDFGKLISEK